MVISIEEMKKILATITYKPKATFSIRQNFADDFPMLEIALRVVDAIDGVSSTTFYQREKIPGRWRKDKETFIHWVFRMVLKAERHEAKEFFRVKDVHLIDPHPEMNPVIRAEEQGRYIHHKRVREHTAELNRRSMEMNSDIVSIYGLGGPPKKYNYDETYKEYKFPNLSQEQLDKMRGEMGDFLVEKKPTPTEEGQRKKALRARSPNGKGYSNKPWDKLR